MSGDILSLDLASTTGWCRGAPGGKVVYGSIKLAPPGASHGEKGASLLRWLTPQLKIRPALLVFEAPMAPSQMAGRTTVSTARVLLGLPFLTETVAYLSGLYGDRVREANVQDVRKHFIGQRTVRGGDPKAVVMRECRRLGFEPRDDNAADAIALWSYAAAIIAPEIGIASTPLFAEGGE